jgi:hypothetical protein
VLTFSGGLYYQATGDDSVRQHVADSIAALITSPSTQGTVPAGQQLTALSVAKQLPGYILAADLVNLGSFNSGLDGFFRTFLTRMLTEPMVGLTVTQAQETLADRTGAAATFARLLASIYTGDVSSSFRVAVIAQGLLGDRASYSDLSTPGFDFGVDTSWQAAPSLPVPIQPAGATIAGHSVDGVVSEEQRQGGSFAWPPVKRQQDWEAIRHLTAALWVLRQRGTDYFPNQSSALKRAAIWMRDQAQLSPGSSSAWAPWVLNSVYTDLHLSTGQALRDTAVGYTDWTHAPVATSSSLPAPLARGYARMIQPAPEQTATVWNAFAWNSAVWNGSLALTSVAERAEAWSFAPAPTSDNRQVASQVELAQAQGFVFDPVPWSAGGILTSLAPRAKALAFALEPTSSYVRPPQVSQGSVRIKGQWLPGTPVTFFDRTLVPEWMKEVHDPLEHAKITTRLASQVGAQQLFQVTADAAGDIALTDQPEGRYLAAGERDGAIRYISVNVESQKTAAAGSPTVVEVPPTPVTPPPDALTQRVLGELGEFTGWLQANNAQGFLGEFGWPDARYAAGDDVLWNGVGTAYYDALRAVPGIWTSQWGASQAFATYELAPYVSDGVGSPLSDAHPQAAPLEAALPDGVRGVALTGLEFGTDLTGFSNSSPGTKGTNYFDEPDGSWAFLAAAASRSPRSGSAGNGWHRPSVAP